MSKVWFNNALRMAALVAVSLAFAGDTARAVPRPAGKRRAFNLFAGVLGRMNVNRFDCGLDAFGKVCVDPNGSSTVGGGFWPKGTPDGYVFNSGLQLAGIVDPASGFAWSSDTVGAFFFDPKGTTEHGDRLSLVWTSLDPSDNANWPRDAFVPSDTSLFDPVLFGRKAASQQDTWIQYWDGNPAFNAGRKHPLGVLVTQRGMAWNFPSGNEDIIYYLYSFTNITASDPAAYAGLLDADTLASLGARFQLLNESAFGVSIPDAGYTITNMYASFSMDADVSDAARENYSTAFIPFNMGTAFKSNWYAEEMLFPASIFSAPFAAAPGIVGVKYLRSPIVGGAEVGLTMFSNTINGGQFDDAQNATQLWRYLSAQLNPTAGDAPCNAPLAPSVGKVCFVSQAADDIRFFQSSGPLNLAPGETKIIVVAYITAAPVDVPAIAGRSQGFDLKPAFPAQAGDLATGADTLRSVDRVMGAVSVNDANGDFVIDQNEVVTVDRSLLNKGLVAQAVFDGKFLLPFPPDPPDFFLVPGNNQVTVVWQASPTETVGDPYFQIASLPEVEDPANPGQFIPNALYDPNYREFDVEGYRVYRGRTTGDLQLVAQFDYAGREIIDYTGAFNYGNCAPELGVTVDCPAGLAGGVAHPLVGNIVQVPPGGRVQLLNGDVLVLAADTAVTGGGSGYPALADGGVPFAYVDRSVRNSFRYYYAVTAFDINSVKSVAAGNAALESPRVTKQVTPRAAGANPGSPLGPITVSLVGAQGEVLNPAAPNPTINATTGTFSGPARPTNAFQGLDVSVFAPDLVAPNSAAFIRLDSVTPHYYHSAIFYFSGLGPVVTGSVGDGWQGSDAGPLGVEDGTLAVGPASVVMPADTDLAKAQGLGPVPLAAQATAQIVMNPVIFNSKDADWGPVVDGAFFEFAGLSDVGGSRWFDGTNETMADPTLGTDHGQLTGVTTIYQPAPYLNVPDALMRRFYQTLYHVFRAADIRIYWGATPGTVDSVMDLTHKVPVPFDPQNRGSYGFRGDVTGDAVSSAPDGLLNYRDFMYGACLPGMTSFGQGGCEDRDYDPTPTLVNVDLDGDLVADGTTGFGLYINGEPYIFETATLPSNTTWTLRSYAGDVQRPAATYSFVPKPSNAPIPGLRLAITTSTAQVTNRDAASDLSNVHTVPDPYYVTNAFEQSTNSKIMRFVNLPSRCIIRIYSQSGVLVNALTLDDPTGGGEATWNLRNRNNQFVASGVYFYHVEAPDGKTKVGRFTIVNFAQ